MNNTSLEKIRKYRSIIFHIDQNRSLYEPVIPLLDEPYKTALLILEYYSNQDVHEVANLTGLNWQTVRQVRSVLE